MTYIQFNKTIKYVSSDPLTVHEVKNVFEERFGLSPTDFYITRNGKRVCDDNILEHGHYILIPRLVGGKGGFGSMLRAIGAQIEKTTNREACRDLSGRRLRDINEEKRLKNWIASQADRERDAADRKQKKIERLLTEPKHKFQDTEYEQIRSELPEKVSNAVEQGLKASTSSTKRKHTEQTDKKKKKLKLWVDAEFEDLSCSDDSSNEDASKVVACSSSDNSSDGVKSCSSAGTSK